MDPNQPFLYDGNLACWMVFENTYRKDFIGMIHFKQAWAHNNMMHPYAYINDDGDGNPIPSRYRKPPSDLPDAITFGLAENGTCSVIARGQSSSNAPKRKKPKITIVTPSPCTGNECITPPIKMCTVWDDGAWAYVQKPC